MRFIALCRNIVKMEPHFAVIPARLTEANAVWLYKVLDVVFVECLVINIAPCVKLEHYTKHTKQLDYSDVENKCKKQKTTKDTVSNLHSVIFQLKFRTPVLIRDTVSLKLHLEYNDIEVCVFVFFLQHIVLYNIRTGRNLIVVRLSVDFPRCSEIIFFFT